VYPNFWNFEKKLPGTKRFPASSTGRLHVWETQGHADMGHALFSDVYPKLENSFDAALQYCSAISTK
jgi:hypothetical protein